MCGLTSDYFLKSSFSYVTKYFKSQKLNIKVTNMYERLKIYYMKSIWDNLLSPESDNHKYTFTS